MEETIGERDEF